MNRLVRGVILVSLLLLVAFATGCMKTAGPGEVGIKVNLAGDNRGVDEIPLETGRIFYFPPTQQVIVYPTWTQAVQYDSLVFNSKEGLSVTADIVVSYSLIPDKVPELYVKYRQPLKQITATYLRNTVRRAFNEIASTMEIDQIYGERKAWLAEQVTNDLRSQLADVGFNIEYVSFAGDLVLPDRVKDAIDDKIQADQQATQAENRVREATAKANQEIEAAKGRAQSVREEAQAQADAIRLVAEAEAEANKILVESLGGADNLIRLKTIEKLSNQINVMLLPNDIIPLVGIDKLVQDR